MLSGVFCQGKQEGVARLYFHHRRRGRRAAQGKATTFSPLSSTCPQDMNLPGLDLHPLAGDRQGYWAVKVSGNWRITFRFLGKDVDAVDYEDYH